MSFHTFLRQLPARRYVGTEWRRLGQLQHGVYIRFFHGRNHPREQLSDWGFDGPLIGPVEISWTYGTLWINSPACDDRVELPVEDDLVHLGDAWYGDFDIIRLDTLATRAGDQATYEHGEWACFNRIVATMQPEHIQPILPCLSKPRKAHRHPSSRSSRSTSNKPGRH